MTLVVVIIILALIFDYINGFHDAANSIATVVSTKVLTPFQAVLWAALFNFAAYWLFKDHAVANSISKTVHKEFITLPVILAGMIAAIFWNLLTWWYGIPSSSSHTLIGGFAGAAIAHAISKEGTHVSWKDIVESDTITKTVLFIFLAPIIGMMISIFITFVTIMRNVWVRLGIIAVATTITVMILTGFEKDKVSKNIEKFFKVDKYKTELAAAKEKLAKNPEDAACLQAVSKADEKLQKAMPIVDSIEGLSGQLHKIGAAGIAERAYNSGWLNEIAVSRLKDDVRNANSYLVMESRANSDTAIAAEYAIAKLETEKYKKPLAKYLDGEMTIDSTMLALNAIYPIEPSNYDKVRQRLTKFNVEKSLQKEIDMADNSAIVWGIILAAILFSLAYLYAEFFRTPSAYRTANMFKKLQLLSSAAFSIGHGGNDAQKVMGIIGAALIANGSIQEFGQLPGWVPLSCYLAIGLGTMSGGWKIVKTMGTKITKVTPLEGVSAETAGALTLFFTGQMGIPVSTTHTITGSIVGVGATKRLSAVRWGVTVNLLWAWILTIPVSAILAAITYYIVSLFL